MALKGKTRILVVDDDKNVIRICSHLLKREGWDAIGTQDPLEVLDRLREDPSLGIVLLDIKMPQKDGMQILREVRRFLPGIEVVMMTAHGNIDIAVEAMREGACDFVPKPFTRDRLVAATERALRFLELRDEVQRLRTEIARQFPFENIVGSAPPMKEVFDWMARAAQSDSTVLLLGESGTGKDLVARTIHYNSTRAPRPFLAVNCAALPKELIESELFGYVKGAFTGATSDSVGIFRAADGGTIFLDEICEMPPAAQAKLLRVLQDRSIRPVGAVSEMPVDVRVVAATNRDVEKAVETGDFRKDLYYRVSVITFRLPSLRERREDVPTLAEHFVGRFNRRAKTPVRGIDPKAMEILTKAPWPGNVRELENVIERAFAMMRGDIITAKDLPPELARAAAGPVPVETLESLAETEKAHVKKVIEALKGNISRAARVLGVSRKRLYRLMNAHGLKTE